jgi:GT2 family glycosyltransferase
MIPQAIVYHRYRGAMSKFPSRQAFFTHRNSEFVYFKNMPAGLMLSHLPARIAYELAATVYSFRAGYGKTFVRAKMDALRQMADIVRKRKQIQERRTISNAQLHMRMQNKWVRSKWKKLLSARRDTFQAEG